VAPRALLVVLLLGAACGTPKAPDGEASDSARVARLHRSKCGKCHTLVQPGTRTRAQLDEALPRHRSRVHMTDSDWEKMIDYLAVTSTGVVVR
jgi:hypothetical protein